MVSLFFLVQFHSFYLWHIQMRGQTKHIHYRQNTDGHTHTCFVCPFSSVRPFSSVFVSVRPCSFSSDLVRALPCSSVLVRVRPFSSDLVRVRPCSSVFVRSRPCSSVLVRVLSVCARPCFVRP
uniref:Secreted protein n=1 Tax=Meloidogyne incognita TaxID=6306 RepID=A0A914M0M3_MELIC